MWERVPGQLYGEGHGLIELDGGDGAIWNGHGIGTMTGEGTAMRFRFSLAVQAGADGKLSSMNSVLVVGEHETDAEGNTKTTAWEWK